MNIKDQRRQIISEAESLSKAAKERDLTAAEMERCKAIPDELSKIDDHIDRVRDGEDLLKKLGAAGKQLGGVDGQVDWGVEGRGFLRLKSEANATARRLTSQIHRNETGRKSLLASGAVTTMTQVDTTPIPLGKPATSIFDVLPTVLREVPAYKYLRQTVRTNNAAVVAPGATKPTSIYTIDDIDASLSVIAHLSEAMDEYLLSDNQELMPFIAAELSYGLAAAVETKVVADVLATSGLQVQAFSTDVFATTRKAVTDLENMGVTAGYWLMNPADWEAIELFKDSQGRYLINSNGPVDVAARRLWSAPVVVTPRVTAASTLLVGTGALELSTDGATSLRWAQINDDFTKNQIRARCEGRYNTDVQRPWAIVKTALA